MFFYYFRCFMPESRTGFVYGEVLHSDKRPDVQNTARNSLSKAQNGSQLAVTEREQPTKSSVQHTTLELFRSKAA